MVFMYQICSNLSQTIDVGIASFIIVNLHVRLIFDLGKKVNSSKIKSFTETENIALRSFHILYMFVHIM